MAVSNIFISRQQEQQLRSEGQKATFSISTLFTQSAGVLELVVNVKNGHFLAC